MACVVNELAPKLIGIMSSDHPIGVIDSGLGGLTIRRSIVNLLPNESIIYIGDQEFVPYSEKAGTVIIDRIKLLVKYLLRRDAKLIVIACNTATVAAIDITRITFPDVPIVGVVPVIKTAAAVTKTGKFAVLSTSYTANSMYQRKLIQAHAQDCQVMSIPCPTLVTYVEKGDVSSQAMRKDLTRILEPVLHSDIDTVVLGCTHFPFLTESIQRVLGSTIRLLDSGGAVARQVVRVLEQNKALATKSNPVYYYVTTGNAMKVSGVATKLLGESIQFKHVSLNSL